MTGDENPDPRTLPLQVGADPQFEAVYQAHVGLVWRCLRRAGVPEAALEDATQEVFLVYHRRRHEFRGDSSVRTWLVGIARGIAANVRRGEQRMVRRLEARRVEPGSALARDELEREAAQAEARALVGRFLASLPPTQRVVFEWIEIEGFKQREVADLLDVSINTVGSRLRAARAAFATYLQGLEEPEEAAHG